MDGQDDLINFDSPKSPIHPESQGSSDADETNQEATEINTSGTEETVIERKLVENQAPPKAEEVLVKWRNLELKHCELREQACNFLKKYDEYENLCKEYKPQFTTYYERLLSYKEKYTRSSTTLSKLEDAYFELHKKYEDAEAVIIGLKENEDTYKEQIRTITEQYDQQAKESPDIIEISQNQNDEDNETYIRRKADYDDFIKDLKNCFGPNEVKLASVKKALEQIEQACEEMKKYL